MKRQTVAPQVKLTTATPSEGDQDPMCSHSTLTRPTPLSLVPLFPIMLNLMSLIPPLPLPPLLLPRVKLKNKLVITKGLVNMQAIAWRLDWKKEEPTI